MANSAVAAAGVDAGVLGSRNASAAAGQRLRDAALGDRAPQCTLLPVRLQLLPQTPLWRSKAGRKQDTSGSETAHT